MSFFFCGLKKRKDGHDNWKLAQKRVNARAKEIFAKLKEKAHSSKIPNPHRSATGGLRCSTIDQMFVELK